MGTLNEVSWKNGIGVSLGKIKVNTTTARVGMYGRLIAVETGEILASIDARGENTGAAVSVRNLHGLSFGSEEFNKYIQDALDLVEFANGDANTKWGAIRIAMGHEKPFNVKYLGIGNEQWGEVYFSRYEAFKTAFEEAAIDDPTLYGDIELIVANGPVASDRYAWNKINVEGTDYAGLVDEHYYMEASWFLTNTDRYDTYDRNNVAVFLGEYAAKANTAEAALAEAAFMTGIESFGLMKTGVGLPSNKNSGITVAPMEKLSVIPYAT